MNVDIYANLRLAAWREALRVLTIQLVILLAGAALIGLIFGRQFALGVLIGGAIGFLANVYLAIALLGKPLLQGKPSNVLVSWLIKAVLTLSLLLIAMRAKIVAPLSLIIGIFVVLVGHWLAVTFWLSRRR